MSDTKVSQLRIAPEFVEPTTILNLTEAQQAELLEGIRQRRLVAVTQYLQIQEERKRVKEEAYQIKYEKAAKKIAKHISKIDEELEKLAAEFGKMRTLRFEALDIT